MFDDICPYNDSEIPAAILGSCRTAEEFQRRYFSRR